MIGGLLLVGVALFALTAGAPDEFEALSPEALAAPPSGPVERGREVGLLANRGTLWIESTPAGAAVRIDARLAGRTPFRSGRLPSQWYVISVELEGYATVDTLVFLEALAATRLSLSLPVRAPTDAAREGAPAPAEAQPTEHDAEAAPIAPEPAVPTGALRITSNPPRAAVLLDGHPVGVTPLDLDAVPAGRHTVTVSYPGYERASFDVEAVPGQRQTLAAELARREGVLSVAVLPWGSIYIDGSLLRRDTDVRSATSLPAGSYELRVVHPTLGERVQAVTVWPGQRTDVTIDLSQPRR